MMSFGVEIKVQLKWHIQMEFLEFQLHLFFVQNKKKKSGIKCMQYFKY